MTTKKRRPAEKKTAKQLDVESELYRHLNTGDSNPSLVTLDDDGKTVSKATKAQLQEFVQIGTVDGRYDRGIGISFEDRYENRVAISLTKKEAQCFLPLL